MANRRRSARFLRHLHSLGFATVDAYLEWCRTHGFAAKTSKSPGKVSREFAQINGRALRSLLALEHPVEIDWLDGLRLLLDGAPTRRQADRQQPCELVIGGQVRLQAGEPVVFETQQTWCCLPESWSRGFSRKPGPPERRALRDLVDVVEVRARPLLEGRATAGRESLAYATGFFHLAARHREWLRRPADWRAPEHDLRGQFSSLANHLLAEYPVPDFMAMAWLRDDDAGPARRDLFLHVGRGNNPRTGKTPVPLTRRMAHHFVQAPAHYSIEGAMRWGQIAALGGTPQLADACAATRLGEHFGNDAFWVSVIR